MPTHDVRAAVTNDADTEAYEAAAQETSSQAATADSHAAGVEMLKDERARDNAHDQAVDNILDALASKQDNAEVAVQESAEVAAPDGSTQGVEQTEQLSQEQVRSAFLNDLREQMDALKPLDDAALERVLDCASDIQKMRGQLVEELGNLELEKIANDMGPEYSFIRGDQIRDQNNRQVTDGMIVREAEDGQLDVVGIVEAKAGRASRRELSASRESFDNLSQADRLELQQAAIDDFREDHGMGGPGDAGWKNSQEILNDHVAEIDERMREMHGADIGQLSRDFERLMPNAGDEAVSLKIRDDDTDVRADRDVRVNRAQTEAYVVTPSDVSTQRTLENLQEKEPNIGTNSVYIAQTGGEISELAKAMQDVEQRYRLDATGPENAQSQTAGEEQAATQAEEERTQRSLAEQAAQAQIDVEQQRKAQAVAIEAAEEVERARIRSLEQAEEAFEHA